MNLILIFREFGNKEVQYFTTRRRKSLRLKPNQFRPRRFFSGIKKIKIYKVSNLDVIDDKGINIESFDLSVRLGVLEETEKVLARFLGPTSLRGSGFEGLGLFKLNIVIT